MTLARRAFAEPQKYVSHGKVIGYMIQWQTPDKKRRTATFPFARFTGDKRATYNAALAELRRVNGELQAIADGRKPYNPESPTLQEFFDNFWEPNRNAKKRHPDNDRHTWTHYYKDTLGPSPLKDINTAAVESFKAKAFRDQKPATQKNVLALLKGMLHYAADLGLIFAVPRIRTPKVAPYEFHVLETPADVEKLLRAAKSRGDAHALYATAIYAGLRAGELAGLRWADVDLDRRLITVRWSYDAPPKSGKHRFVPILDALHPILQRWKTISATLPNTADLVFPSNDDGRMLRPDSRIFKQAFHAALKRAGLPHLRFHELRHTFASMWCQLGGNPYELKEALGHADFKTMEKYAHFLPGAFRGADGMFKYTPARKKRK